MIGKCPACNANLSKDNAVYDPRDCRFALCPSCGHIYVECPTRWRDMTEAEKSQLRRQSWAEDLRNRQLQIVESMVG
jgi:hypothetical protein